MRFTTSTVRVRQQLAVVLVSQTKNISSAAAAALPPARVPQLGAFKLPQVQNEPMVCI